MPSVNLRLDDSLHAALVAAAAASGRSLQREIIVRLDGRVSGGLEGREVGGGDARENRADGLASGGGATGSVTMKQDPGASRPSSPSATCSRQARHHINHGGNPCQVCGYPSFKEGSVS